MSDSCGCGNVEVGALEGRQRRVLIVVLVINLAAFAMMLAAALYSGSSSLLSGTLDNLGPDLVVAIALLVLFLRSAWRVLTRGWREFRGAPTIL